MTAVLTSVMMFMARYVKVSAELPEYKGSYDHVDNQGNAPSLKSFLIDVSEVRPGIFREV